MLHAETFLSCILIAAIGSAAGSPAPETSFSLREDAVLLGPSFPKDTVYVQYYPSPIHLNLSIVNISRTIGLWTVDNCKWEATSRGGHLFEVIWYLGWFGQCSIATLQFPLCRTRHGPAKQDPIYIQEQFLTDGTENDGTIVKNLQVNAELQTKLSNPGDGYGTFRVKSPTILNFPDHYHSTDFISKQTIFTDNKGLVEVKDGILVDPVCYTNSACGVPFVYAHTTSIAPANLAWLSKSCGQLVTITKGQPRYILSHEGIGCQNFPNSGYGSGTCSVNYRGYSDTGVIITVEFVNFKGSDSCDGFSLTVTSFNTQTDSTKTTLCSTSTTEIFSAASRGRIDFSGIAKNERPKYGFIIKLRDA